MKKSDFDTNKTRASQFAQHGRMQSRIEDNILVNEATGPFNAEIINAIQTIQHDLLELISTRDQWAQIYIFRDSALCSPDTIEALRNYLSGMRGKLKRPAATAFVMGQDVEGRSIMAQHYRQVYEDADLKFELFFTEQQAHDWLRLLLNQPAEPDSP